MKRCQCVIRDLIAKLKEKAENMRATHCLLHVVHVEFRKRGRT